jgi:hypothetical protein
MRSLTIMLATALAALALGAATAHGASYRSATSFGFFAGSPDAFLGQVSSPHRGCVSGRLVKVYRVVPRGGARVFGTARGSSTGQWKVERADVPRARYYVVVPARRAGRHTCREYRSSTLLFG